MGPIPTAPPTWLTARRVAMGAAAASAFALATPVFAWSSAVFGPADWTATSRALVYLGAALATSVAAARLTGASFSARRIARFVGLAVACALVCQVEELAEIFLGDRIIPAWTAAPVVVFLASVIAAAAALSVVAACAVIKVTAKTDDARVDAPERAAIGAGLALVVPSLSALYTAMSAFRLSEMPSLVPLACFLLANVAVLVATGRRSWRELFIVRVARGRHAAYRLLPMDDAASNARPMNGPRERCNAVLVRGASTAYRDGTLPLALVIRP